MAKSNPNKANQYKPDPRQALFLTLFLDPESETFSNALQSGIKAGYGKKYSENLTAIMPTWLREKMGDSAMLSLAEQNLQRYLKMSTIVPALSMFGPVIDKDTKKPIMKENTELMKIQADTSKFVLERLNKRKYSARQELTGKDGKDLPTPIYGGKSTGKDI